MITGKEGICTWAGGVVLNRRDLDVHYRVNEITGLRSTGDFAPEADPTIGRVGEAPRESERAGKTLSYTGDVIARALDDLREAQGALTAAFVKTREQRMTHAPHPDYTGPALPTRFFHGRPLDCACDDGNVRHPTTSRSGGYEMPFLLTLRLSDPRYFHPDLIELSDTVAAAVGGAGVPFTPGGRSAPPSGQGFVITTDNPGEFHSDAIMRAIGPLRNPVFSSQTSGRFLRFKDLNVPGGQHVEIDFRRRKAKRSTGENVRHKLDPSSTWWDRGESGECILPGENELRLRGYSVGVGAAFEVDYRPADVG